MYYLFWGKGVGANQATLKNRVILSQHVKLPKMNDLNRNVNHASSPQ